MGWGVNIMTHEHISISVFIYIYIYIDLLPLMTGDKKIWIFNRARHEIKTRQATYVYRNIDARSCKHCYI